MNQIDSSHYRIQKFYDLAVKDNMRTIIIISRCLKAKTAKNSTTYIFHFKGVYLGQQVNSLELIHQEEFLLGHDYVMRVKIHSIDSSKVLKGEVLYAKDLDDFTSH